MRDEKCKYWQEYLDRAADIQMGADIFISFASKDVKVALTLCSAIESRGFKCWISARDIQPGDNFQVSIVQALRTAKVLLLVFTANSNTSEEMTKELALASQRKMIVIPLRVEDVTPGDAFAYEFATRQWIDAFADWEFSIEQLCRRLEHGLSAPADNEAPAKAMPAPSSVKAEEKPAPPPKPEKSAPSPGRPVSLKAEPDAGRSVAPRIHGRRLAVAAVVLVIIAGLGAAASMLMGSKPAPASTPAPAGPAIEAAQPAPSTAGQTLETAAAALPAQPAVNDAVAQEEVAVAEPVKPVTPRKRKVATRTAAPTTDIPY